MKSETTNEMLERAYRLARLGDRVGAYGLLKDAAGLMARGHEVQTQVLGIAKEMRDPHSNATAALSALLISFGIDPTEPEPERELSFDGCGINGPDKYRTRLCTFTEVRGPNAKKYGHLFAAAPDLLAAAGSAVYQFEQMEKMFRDDAEFMSAFNSLRGAIAKAEGSK